MFDSVQDVLLKIPYHDKIIFHFKFHFILFSSIYLRLGTAGADKSFCGTSGTEETVFTKSNRLEVLLCASVNPVI